MSLTEALPAGVFAVMLVFARVGGVMMLVPGFGDVVVPQRLRLILALYLSVLLASVLTLPPIPAAAGDFVGLVGGELLTGVFLGMMVRIMVSALDAAGVIISLQMGLAIAQMYDPGAAQQSVLTSVFVSMMGVLLMFLTDTHHLLLRGIANSYGLFVPGALLPVGDLADSMAHMTGASFRLGLELSAPFVIMGILFNVALGLISRLMPQLQLFMVVMPLQIIGGLAILGGTLLAVMTWFLDDFTRALNALLLPG